MRRIYRAHFLAYAEAFEMQGTLGRDELAAQLWPGKLFLFDEQDTRPRVGKMDRGATARRSATGDDYVVGVGIAHYWPLALNTNRAGKCFLILISFNPAVRATACNSSGCQLFRIESAPSSRIKRL